jgi:D-sedoheptulose 7-phosphate isomerase
MIENSWEATVSRVQALLGGLSFRDGTGHDLAADQGFDLWRETTVRLRERHGTVYLVGNGASASMASHLAADLAKNGRVHTGVFSDLSLITAISNDMGYEWVFAEPLRRRARAGDMLVAISSSGRSPNVLKAVDVARELGVCVVTLSAMEPENPLRQRGMLNAYIGADDYGFAESCHATILHRWMDLVQLDADALRDISRPALAAAAAAGH